MSESYLIRQYKDGDEVEIVELLKLVFPEWMNRRSAHDYWFWKYRSTPFGSVIFVALFEGKIVGIRHDILLKMKLGELEYLCSYSDDSVTHPDYQGKGINNLLYEEKNKLFREIGVSFVYDVPIHRAFQRKRRPGQMFLKQKVIHYFRVNDTEAYVNSKNLHNPFFAKVSIAALKGLGNINTALFNPKKNKDLKIIKSTYFKKEASSLWQEVSSSLNFGLVRSPEYLNWRYCDRNAGRFFVRQAFDNDKLVGYSVGELRGEEGNFEGYLMDVFSLPDRSDIVYSLVIDLLNEFEARRVHSIHYRGVEGNPTTTMLGRLGFVPVPHQEEIMVKVSFRNLPDSAFDVVNNSNPEEIHFGYGDYI